MPEADPDTITVLRALTTVATRRKPFSADDVRKELHLRGIEVARTGDPRLRVHPNSVGNAFRLARKTGLVIELGIMRSTSPAARCRRITIYMLAGAPGIPEPMSQQLVIL